MHQTKLYACRWQYAHACSAYICTDASVLSHHAHRNIFTSGDEHAPYGATMRSQPRGIGDGRATVFGADMDFAAGFAVGVAVVVRVGLRASVRTGLGIGL